jgi:phage shock protein B
MDMETPIIIAVSCLGVVMIISTLGLMVYLIIKAYKGGSKSASSDADETRMIQEIYHGLQRMEKRVETLETIIIDADRTKESRFDKELRD